MWTTRRVAVTFTAHDRGSAAEVNPPIPNRPAVPPVSTGRTRCGNRHGSTLGSLWITPHRRGQTDTIATMSRPLVGRPTLLPTLRRLWRDSRRLQLGTDPERAVLLELSDPSRARVLDLLDGGHTEAGVIRQAAREGIPSSETTALLAALRAAGLVLDQRAIHPRNLGAAGRHRLSTEVAALAMRRNGTNTPAGILRRRRAASVLITGASRLAVPIACALGSAGVGHPWPEVEGVTRVTDSVPAGLIPADAHRPRGVAAVEALRRAAPDAVLTPLRPTEATFAVLAGQSAPAPVTALSLAARHLPHLAVDSRDGTMIVGPLVRPGVTPCLNCLDLHRRDRDPAWPILAAQLHTAPDGYSPLAVTTALAGVAYAVAEVLRHIDGGVPRTLGATIELDEPGRERRRQWGHHPNCGCVRTAPTRSFARRQRDPND